MTAPGTLADAWQDQPAHGQTVDRRRAYMAGALDALRLSMLCEHLEFPHFRSHQGTTLQTLGRLRVALQKRGIDAAAESLQREAARFFEPVPPPPGPGAALAAAWKASPQQQELFA